MAALCDVYQPALEAAGKLAPAAVKVRDAREIFDNKDIDVVLVGSPDHWHALHTILACRAGKDVYVEKPVSVTIAEGRKMVEAARKYQRVVQVGTQQHSGAHFKKAVDIVQRRGRPRRHDVREVLRDIAVVERRGMGFFEAVSQG